MKKVVTTITAAIFALGLASAGLAQTTQTPAKPEVKKEATTVTTPATPKEAGKPEVVKPGAVKSETAKEADKPVKTKKELKKEAKEAKKEAKKAAKKEKAEEKSQPEKK
jgi:hypothetical protein